MNGQELLIVIGMAAAVYVPKVLPLTLVSERTAHRMRRWLQYVAPAVLGALVAPSIVAPDGQIIAPRWEWAGYLAAGVIAATTRHMLGALAAGAAVLVLVAIVQAA